MSRSHANPPGTQDQQGGLDSRPARDALETLQANTDEVEALRLTNQRLLSDLEELTRQMQRQQEERQHHNAPRDVDGEVETSQAKKPCSSVSREPCNSVSGELCNSVLTSLVAQFQKAK